MLQTLFTALAGAPARWRAGRALRRAVRLRESDACAEAAALLERELVAGSTSVEVRLLLSDLRREAGSLEAAARLAREAAALAPGHADAHALLGAALLAAEQAEAAVQAYARACELQPQDAPRQAALATALVRAGRASQALRHFERASQAAPLDDAALVVYALALRDEGRLADAEAALRAVAARQPRDPGVANNLATVLADRGAFREARALLEPVVSAHPGLLEPRCTLARILFDLGEPAQAVAHLDQAIAGHPASADARLARGLCMLALGDFAGGWDDYASRCSTRESPARGFPFPEWDGGDLRGKAILVYAEQGIGDELMFASCYGDVLHEARRVVIECDPRLAGLIGRSFPAATVQADRGRGAHPWIEGLGRIDVQAPAGGLPGRYRRSREAFPAHRGYLVADPERVASHRARLAALGPGSKVGLAWRGGVARTRRALRSLAPDPLRALLARDDAQFVCLQHDAGEAEVEALAAMAPGRFHWWRGVAGDVEEVAALLCALDLTVTACNYLVHLGGALGCDVRVMVPPSPEWRYLREGAAMPWYPSVRLFRARDGEGWEPVVQAIARTF